MNKLANGGWEQGFLGLKESWISKGSELEKRVELIFNIYMDKEISIMKQLLEAVTSSSYKQPVLKS